MLILVFDRDVRRSIRSPICSDFVTPRAYCMLWISVASREFAGSFWTMRLKLNSLGSIYKRLLDRVARWTREGLIFWTMTQAIDCIDSFERLEPPAWELESENWVLRIHRVYTMFCMWRANVVLLTYLLTAVDCVRPGPFYNGFLDGQSTTFGSVVVFRSVHLTAELFPSLM